MLRRSRGFTVIALALFLAACAAGRPPDSPAEVLAAAAAALPSDPGDSAWRRAPLHAGALIVQDLVEPRLMTPSTAQVKIQALSDGTRVAFRLEWADATRDDLPGAGRFPDACAVQLPQSVEADVPAPQMGEPEKAVEIAYWRASWQAAADGRADDIRALHPGAAVDHYPFEAPSLEPGKEAQAAMAARYAPARALGNAMEGPRGGPVQDLIAAGPGSLEPAKAQRSTGAGRRTAAGWAVVIARPLPAGLKPGGRSMVAVAIWEGGRQEVGSRKMRSPWIPLALEARP